MACLCPWCGIEYEDVNALMEQRSAALRGQAARDMGSVQEGSRFLAELAARSWSEPQVLEDNCRVAGPGERFLSKFGGGE